MRKAQPFNWKSFSSHPHNELIWFRDAAMFSLNSCCLLLMYPIAYPSYSFDFTYSCYELNMKEANVLIRKLCDISASSLLNQSNAILFVTRFFFWVEMDIQTQFIIPHSSVCGMAMTILSMAWRFFFTSFYYDLCCVSVAQLKLYIELDSCILHYYTHSRKNVHSLHPLDEILVTCDINPLTVSLLCPLSNSSSLWRCSTIYHVDDLSMIWTN